MNRFFHRWTAYFNYYFNALQSYELGERQAMRNLQFDYTRPLPLCLAGLPEASLETGGEMSRVVDKCASLIRLHSITVKPERGAKPLSAKQKAFYGQNEFNVYARKAWLLIGKARIWNVEYEQAQQALDFSMRQHAGQSEGWESALWMARLEMLTGDTLEARNRITSLAFAKERPKNKRATHLLESIWTDLLVSNGQYAEAIPHAIKALETARRGEERARNQLTLAQLYELCERYPEALDLYKKVARSAPRYEMSFNAEVRSASLTARVQGRDMERTLRKMARDEKNVDYLDQIYFALGQIALAKGDSAEAISFYKESATLSTNNPKQKGVSFMTVADFHYNRKEYLEADQFYDSTLSVLPESHPSYDKVLKQSLGLSKLANASRTILHEDSLLRVAALPETERTAFIQQIIDNIIEQERQEKLQEEQEARDRQFAMQNQYRRGIASQESKGSGFYFYNPSTLTYGRTDFRMRWGNRKLEDNWRRRDKGENLPTGQDEGGGTAEDPKATMSDRTQEYYLHDLPLTDSAKKASHARIAQAFLQQGEALRNDVQNNEEAIAAYRTLADRYPNTAEAAEGCYLAYLTAREAKLPDQEREFRERILREYPSSMYAQMISDPQYLHKRQQEKQHLEKLYGDALAALLNGQRHEAQRLAQEGENLSHGGEYTPPFALLNALSSGDAPGDAQNVAALQAFTKTYPNSEQGAYAQEVLRAIERRTLTGAAAREAAELIAPPSQPSERESGYTPSEGEHLIALLVPSQSDLQLMTFKTLGFCVDYDVNLNLNVTNEPLNEEISIILVETFENRATAKKLLNALRETNPYEGRMPTALIISPENFRLLKDQKTFLPYQEFYKRTYGE